MLQLTTEGVSGPHAGATMRRSRPRVLQVQLGHVVLLATGDAGVRGHESAHSEDDEQHYTVLVHAGENGSTRSTIVSSDSAIDAVTPARWGLRAVAVPDRLLPPHSSAHGAIPLADTAFVKASRAMLPAFFSDACADATLESTAATEDVVVAIVRGILREQRPALVGTMDGDEVDRRVWLLIADRHREPEFDVDAIARELSFSRRQLYRRVTGEAGVAALIAQHRLSTAMQLIGENPSRPLSDVASMSGFSRQATMRALFSARLGMTPADYRRSILTPAR